MGRFWGSNMTDGLPIYGHEYYGPCLCEVQTMCGNDDSISLSEENLNWRPRCNCHQRNRHNKQNASFGRKRPRSAFGIEEVILRSALFVPVPHHYHQIVV